MQRKIREIRIEGNIAFVPLTKCYEAVIDASDAALVARWNWVAKVVKRKNGSVRAVYAQRRAHKGELPTTIYLHRVIAATPAGHSTDHIDGDGLNNRSANLRGSTACQNSQNQRKHIDGSSGVKGVTWDKSKRKWKAQIMTNGVKRNIGRFDTLEGAARAYEAASIESHGIWGRRD